MTGKGEEGNDDAQRPRDAPLDSGLRPAGAEDPCGPGPSGAAIRHEGPVRGRAGWVEWVFARDLLADGLIADAGDGDVRIRPAADDPEVVVIELSSPSGHAMFEASAQELADFLDRTYDVVVPGNEHLWVNVDEALTHLISNDLS